MGLDQFAHIYENIADIPVEGKGERFASWRKHPSLQGWMENLWEEQDCPNDSEDGSFNCVSLELDIIDIARLEEDIKSNSLPETEGLFFGDDSSDRYKEKDLKFIEDARKALNEGKVVVYNSWW
jgi:hypothetical protein